MDATFDGSTAARACKPGHTPCLLEQNNVYQGRDAVGLYLEYMGKYYRGEYNGDFRTWGLYWEHVKPMLGINGFKKDYQEPVSVKIGNILYCA